MGEKIDKNFDAKKENLSDKKSKEDALRFEKQDLRILRSSIEENQIKYEISNDIIEHDKNEAYVVSWNNIGITNVWLNPMSEESLQKRRESAQSVVTMVQDASQDTWVVGILWSWATRILDGIGI